MRTLAPLHLAKDVTRFESDARTCAHSQSFAKQNPLR